VTSDSGPPPPRPRSQIREALDAAHEPGGMREALDAATGIGGPEDDAPLADWAVPRQPRWRELVAAWAWGLVTGALAVVIGSLIYGWLSSH
jgi:hypothetical protein